MSYVFHVVSLVQAQTLKSASHDAYVQKTINFCKMMKDLGHTVYLYASEDNDAHCDELITCITKQEQYDLIGVSGPEDNLLAEYDSKLPYWELFNGRVIEGIKSRLHSRKDFICIISGLAQEPIAAAFPDMISVEYGIGYTGTFSQFRVFESHAWRHFVMGLQGDVDQVGSFYDIVIPNYYDVADFPFSNQKSDYFLFVGRLISRKGYQIAVEACEREGARLIIAGQGDPPEYGEYVGLVGVGERGRLMTNAKAVFVPTQYVGPYEGVHAEARLCGTPVITTDWGVFTESVENGIDGFRCRTMGEFQAAMHRVDKLNPSLIRQRAIDRNGLGVIAIQYEQYFHQLFSLWSDGWYTSNPGRFA